MRKTIAVFAFALLLACGLAFAESQPSSKSTAAIGKIAMMEATSMEATTIMANTLKTSTGTDLFVDVSMECGLFTSVKVDSMGGVEDRAEAMAGVEVTVLVDGREAMPGPVTFCRRSEVLKAEFQGLLTDDDGSVCISEDLENPGTMIIDEDCLRPETLEMVHDTMGSHSFNFVYPNLRSGVHTIEVLAKVDSYIESTLYSGAKVLDTDIFGDEDVTFKAGDTILSVDRSGKFQVGQVIIIDDERLMINAIQKDGTADPSGNELVVTRGYDGTTEAAHTRGTRIYIVAGADASATLGNGSVTVQTVRMLKGEDFEF
jgi:hypothetical protein